MSEEIDITEAMKLWNERLSDNCTFRIASRCNHVGTLSGQCNIIICPILYQETGLKIIYKFRDEKK